jgi:hypothetical protein
MNRTRTTHEGETRTTHERETTHEGETREKRANTKRYDKTRDAKTHKNTRETHARDANTHKNTHKNKRRGQMRNTWHIKHLTHREASRCITKPLQAPCNSCLVQHQRARVPNPCKQRASPKPCKHQHRGIAVHHQTLASTLQAPYKHHTHTHTPTSGVSAVLSGSRVLATL